MTGIDLDTVEEDEGEAEEVATNCSHHSQASSAATTATSRPSAVCLELWHACAGPVALLPRKGSVVVYLPQGHLGDAAAGGAPAMASAVPPHVFCRVVDVTLHVLAPADAATDEVYAQLSLAAENEEVARRLREGADDGSGGDAEDGEKFKQRFARMPHMCWESGTVEQVAGYPAGYYPISGYRSNSVEYLLS